MLLLLAAVLLIIAVTGGLLVHPLLFLIAGTHKLRELTGA